MAADYCYHRGTGAQVNVSLTPELEGFVHSKVQSGQYHSASEVILEALRLLEEHDRSRAAEVTEFRGETDRRLASLNKGESVDGEEAFALIRQRSVDSAEAFAPLNENGRGQLRRLARLPDEMIDLSDAPESALPSSVEIGRFYRGVK